MKATYINCTKNSKKLKNKNRTQISFIIKQIEISMIIKIGGCFIIITNLYNDVISFINPSP